MDWVVDLEISLVKAFNWSLYDMDNTDIESLLPFVARLAQEGDGQASLGRIYCDDPRASWL